MAGAEYVKQDMYIEQLEEKIEELQEQVAENFQMYELERRHSRKLMTQMTNLRKPQRGKWYTFHPGAITTAKAPKWTCVEDA